MKTFEEYITDIAELAANEAFYNQWTGGGVKKVGGGVKSTHAFKPAKVFHSAADNRFQDMDQRVAFGKNMEDKIIAALKNEYGWDISKPTASQDMHDKIDGWMRTKEGIEVPIQVKYRDADSKDDILVEVIRNWTPEMFTVGPIDYSGRDMKGSAVLYAVLNKAGNTIRIRKAKECKEQAKIMCEKLAKAYRTDSMRMLTLPQGQIRIQQDPRTGSPKVVAYINPNSFNDKNDLPINKSLWAA